MDYVKTGWTRYWKLLNHFLNIILQLFDITTTVDPSYVISLIRKLLPTDATATHKLHDNGACCVHTQGSNIDKMEENESTDSHWCSSRDVSGRMEIVDVHKSAPGERESEDPYNGVEHTGHDVYAGEEVWEEYGCILWDLAASKTHAELMVLDIFLSLSHNVFFCYLDSNFMLCS